MSGAVSFASCSGRLHMHRSGLQSVRQRLPSAPQGLPRCSRAERLSIDAKKKRHAPKAAKTQTEKKPAPVEEQEAEEAEVPTASDPLEVSTASSSPGEEQPPQVQEVQLSISEADLKSLKAAIRNKQSGEVQEPGLIEGILEEVRLISWPNPLQALSDTFVVIAIVGGTAVTLFFVNSLLADISKRIY